MAAYSEEPPQSDIERIESITDDDNSKKQLKAALKQGEAREFATTYIIRTEKVTEGRGSMPCTNDQVKALIDLSDVQRIRKEIKVDEISTASKNTVRITDIDVGSAKQPLLPPEERKVSLKETNNSRKENIEHPPVEDSRKVKESDENRGKNQDDIDGQSKRREQTISERRKMQGAETNTGDGMKNEYKEIELLNQKVEELEGKLARELAKKDEVLKQNKELTTQLNDYKTKFEKAERENNENKRKFDELHQSYETDMRDKHKQLKDISAERDEIRKRFMKVAGAKLTDHNADIADLKDPNRALKLSEKFGKLYNNEWTDAFVALKKKKLPKKEAICLLLQILKKCLAFCDELKNTQMVMLKSVLLHPAQNVPDPRKHIGGLKDKPTFSTEDEKAALTLRRQIAVKNSIVEEIKQDICRKLKSEEYEQVYEKKHLDLCVPYIQTCTEICWLIVLHDPPLHIELDVKSGDKLDSDLYTIYESPGNRIDFVVWPVLFNEKSGGLLKKGVAQPLAMPEM